MATVAAEPEGVSVSAAPGVVAGTEARPLSRGEAARRVREVLLRDGSVV